MADVTALTAAFNRAHAAGDTAAAQQLHDAIVAGSAAEAPPPAAVHNADIFGGVGALFDAFSSKAKVAAALAGFGDMAALGLANPVGGTLTYAANKTINPLIYAAANPNEPGSFFDRLRAYGNAAGGATLRDTIDAQKQFSEQAQAAEPAAAGTGAAGGFVAGLGGGATSATAKAFQTRKLFPAAWGAVKQAAPIGAVAGAAGSESNLLPASLSPSSAQPADQQTGADPWGVAWDAGKGAVLTAGVAAGIPLSIAGGIATLRGIANASTTLGTSAATVLRQAVNQLRPAIESLDMTPKQFQEYFAAHPQQALADLMQSEAAAVAAGKGQGGHAVGTFLEARELGKTGRVRAELQQATGVAPNAAKPFEVALRDNNAAKVLKAAPYFKAAEETPMELNATLKMLLADPYVAPVWAKAEKGAKTENMLGILARDADKPTPTPPTAWEDMISVLSGKPTPPGALVPPTQGPTPTLFAKLQETLSALGDQGAALTQSGARKEGRRFFQLKEQIGAEISRPGSPAYNPHFVEANRIWSGESAANDAMEAGRNAILKPNQGETQLVVEKLASEAERDAFAYGGMSGIERFLRGGNDLPSAPATRVDQIAKLWKNTEARDALRQVFGPKNVRTYEQVLHVLGSENTMHETFRLSQATGRDNSRLTALTRLGGMIGTIMGIAAHTGTAGVPFGARLAGAQLANALAGKQQALINVQKARLLIGQDPSLMLKMPGLGIDPRVLGPLATGGATTTAGLLGNP